MAKKITLPVELAVQFKGKTKEEKIELLQEWYRQSLIPRRIRDSYTQELQKREEKSQKSTIQRDFLDEDPRQMVQRKKQELRQANRVLAQSLAENSSLSLEKISWIKGLLSLEDYSLFRDEYIAIVITSFKFRANPVKEMGADFLRKMLESSIIEWSVLISIIDLNYLSKKTYNILKDFKEIIAQDGLDTFLHKKLKELYNQGYILDCDTMQEIPINAEKKAMLQELIAFYKPPKLFPFSSLEEEAIARGEIE